MANDGLSELLPEPSHSTIPDPTTIFCLAFPELYPRTMLVEGDPLVAGANISFLAAATRAKEIKAAATEVLKRLFAILAGDAPDREEIAQVTPSSLFSQR